MFCDLATNWQKDLMTKTSYFLQTASIVHISMDITPKQSFDIYDNTQRLQGNHKQIHGMEKK